MPSHSLTVISLGGFDWSVSLPLMENSSLSPGFYFFPPKCFAADSAVAVKVPLTYAVSGTFTAVCLRFKGLQLVFVAAVQVCKMCVCVCVTNSLVLVWASSPGPPGSPTLKPLAQDRTQLLLPPLSS